MKRVRPARVLPLVACCAISSSALLAQTAGTLRGLVLDDKTSPLAGVTIVVASGSLGVTGRGAVTDSAGLFQVGSLPPAGDYFVQASHPGFATVTLSDVEVRSGGVSTVRITLQPETTLRERIEVRASPQVVTLEDTTTETRFSAEFIEALPILGRNYQDLLALVPGVSDVDGDGNPNIHGARDTDVVTLVDGVSTTDPLTGKLGAQLNIESIQEIEVKTSGATAEYSRAQGGFVNVLTKSGGNEFKGTFKFFWRGSALDGDGAGIDDPRLHGGVAQLGLRDLRFNDFYPFLSLEGPIVRDRAWFFMAHEYIQREDPVNALNVAFVAGVREFREFVKLTWQASLNHRLALSVNYDPQEYSNQGLNSLTREESGFTTRLGGPILTAKAISVLNPYVVLETSISSFDEKPARVPTLDPDTNGNGRLAFDYNRNGFIEASERDPGDDFDGDGVFDVFEFFDRNGLLLDRDRDGRRTPPFGCEGIRREDADCDGRLDAFMEDQNGNGILDVGEDTDGDRRLDPGTEDRNGNKRLDDGPFPSDLYPYGALEPLPGDREYSIDLGGGIISGPFFEEFSDRRRRITLRQDLSVYVPDYWGSHDLKLGLVVERENFERRTEARAVVAPLIRAHGEGPSTIRTLVPADRDLENTATGLTGGLYFQDNYKPFPNVSIGFGLRFDRELAESFGYSFFEPAEERALFDRLRALTGGEVGKDDFLYGNNDGLNSRGITGDPIFAELKPTTEQGLGYLLDPLRLAAIRRLTRHHTEARFASDELVSLFPGVVRDGEVDPVLLAEQGVVPQQRERFALTNHNLAPRLSVSWDPFSNGRTKLFATWGRYFDKLFLDTVVGEEGPDTINRYYIWDQNGLTGNGTANHQIGRVLSKAPPSATQVDRGLQTPFSDELTLGIEREIAPELALSVTYISRRFRNQLQDIDVNHALRFDPGTGEPVDRIGRLRLPFPADAPEAAQRLGDGKPDLFIYNYFFNEVLRVGNFNEARYRGVEIELLKRLSRRWELQGSYTYSRAVGAAEDFESELGNDPSTIESEFGYLDYDQRHVVKLNGMTFLPGDWQLGTSVSWSSGLPYSLISRFFALDSVDYQQFRTRFGYTVRDEGDAPRFQTLRRNSRRNDAAYDVSVRARKALVIGRATAAAFLEVHNLLNSDQLIVSTYEPDSFSRFDRDLNPREQLQLDARRRFGRRFQVGFQFEF